MDIFVVLGAKYLIALPPILVGIHFLKLSPERKREMFSFFVLSLPLIFLFSLIAREFYYNPRPFVVGEFTPLLPHKPDNGFPSDHTLLAAALAASMLPFNKGKSLWLWLIAAVIGISRVLAGVHHPIDIIASAVLASLGAYFVFVLLKRRKNI
jgi:undecaprenyl-diphosphatase